MHIKHRDVIQTHPGSQSPVSTETRGSPLTEAVCEIQRTPAGSLGPV